MRDLSQMMSPAFIQDIFMESFNDYEGIGASLISLRVNLEWRGEGRGADPYCIIYGNR